MKKQTLYLHDRIVFMGGAEEVLRMLIRRYGSSHTKIYTLFSPRKTFTVDEVQVPIVTALPRRVNQLFRWGNAQKAWRWVLDYRNLMPLYPLLCRILRKKIQQVAPDLLVISSFAATKNVVPDSNDRNMQTILYLHSPMQYIRENYEEYMHKITGSKRILFKRVSRYLRPRDKKIRSYDEVFANSEYTASCAKKYYDLEAKVRYPEMPELYHTTPVATQQLDYFVYIGRLVRFIREVDLIIELCTSLSLPLLILGSGPDEDYLHAIAGPTVVFVGQITDLQQKIQILSQARGLINLAKESCGMATMEALALGVPVFGYQAGGTQEWVDKESGVLTSNKQLPDLKVQMQHFLEHPRNRTTIRSSFRKKYNGAFNPRLDPTHI